MGIREGKYRSWAFSRHFLRSERNVSQIGPCSSLSLALSSLAPHDINIQHGSSLKTSILLRTSLFSPSSYYLHSISLLRQPTHFIYLVLVSSLLQIRITEATEKDHQSFCIKLFKISISEIEKLNIRIKQTVRYFTKCLAYAFCLSLLYLRNYFPPALSRQKKNNEGESISHFKMLEPYFLPSRTSRAPPTHLFDSGYNFVAPGSCLPTSQIPFLYVPFFPRAKFRGWGLTDRCDG